MPEMVHPKLPADQRITVGDAQVRGWQRCGWQIAPPRPAPESDPESVEPEAPADAPQVSPEETAKPRKSIRKAPVAGDTTPKE